jgi:hypothetical protein
LILEVHNRITDKDRIKGRKIHWFLQLPSFLAINITCYNFWMTYILNYL